MTPYYAQSGVTIYHGDCRDVMDEWAGLRTQRFDLLLTDPPYGIRVARVGHIGSPGPKNIPVTQFGTTTWDDEPAHEALATARRLCRWHVVFGGNFYDLPPASCWLIWDKDNTGDFADCELAWTNLNKAVRRLRYRWNGMLQEPGCPRTIREHPTQKPEAVIRWAFVQATTAPQRKITTVLDPFIGSGTTLVEAKRLGKQAVGIERQERYCEIAARRLSQEALPLEVA